MGVIASCICIMYVDNLVVFNSDPVYDATARSVISYVWLSGAHSTSSSLSSFISYALMAIISVYAASALVY